MHRAMHRDDQPCPCVLSIPALQIVRSQLDQVRSLMEVEFAGEISSSPLRPLMDHVLEGTGKMIRPGMVLISGLCFGRVIEQHLLAAAVMEMIHRATLLHDDVLDCADTRRGRPSAQRLWGNEAAVLLGDLVLSRVLARCADLRPEVGRVVAETACRVCAGELRQNLQRTNWRITEQEYLDIITEKSASFFSACCRIGAILGNASEEQMGRMGTYGLHVGMAFQMTDDVLDLVDSPKDVGKPSGLDASTGIVTLPVIHLLRELGEADREELVNHLHGPQDPSDRLRDLASKQGSLDYVRSRCKDRVDQALQTLEGIKPSDARKALEELAHYSYTRKT